VVAGVVICLERGADLHMAQLMPLPLTVSCLAKSTRVVPEKGPLNGCVCVCVLLWTWLCSRRACHRERVKLSSNPNNMAEKTAEHFRNKRNIDYIQFAYAALFLQWLQIPATWLSHRAALKPHNNSRAHVILLIHNITTLGVVIKLGFNIMSQSQSCQSHRIVGLHLFSTCLLKGREINLY